MAAGIPLATYLAKSAAVSAVQVIATLAVKYFFRTPPLGSAKSPVFSIDPEKKMERVIELFRGALIEKLGDAERVGELLPSSTMDTPLPERNGRFSERAYVQMVDLRPEQINLKGAVRDIIEHIHVKLQAYYDAHRKGWVYNDPSWGTTKPINDPILLILLLINCVLHALGAYRKRINPDDAIALTDALFIFITKLEQARLSSDGRGGDQVSLATLFFAHDLGITKSLQDLRFVFEQEKARRLFVLTTQGIEQAVFSLARDFQNYLLEWLQGNDGGEARTAGSLIVAASADVIPYHQYEALSHDRRPGGLKDMLRVFCDKRNPVQSYHILQLLSLPIELSVETAHLRPDERVLQGLYEKLNLFYSPADRPWALDEFKAYCKTQLETVLVAARFKELPADDLFSMLLWSRYFMIVKNIFDKASILGDLIGCMAGALLPNVINILARLLDEINIAVGEVFTMITARHYGLRAYQDDSRSSNLRSMLSLIVENIRANKETLARLRGDLSIVTSAARLKENEAEIYANLLSLRHSLLMIYPSERHLLEAEMAQFSDEIKRLFSHGVAASLSDTPIHRPAQYSVESKSAESGAYRVAQADADLRKKLSAVLFKEGHLSIINEAYSPTSKGTWKTKKAKSAKSALAQFIRERGHIQPVEAALTEGSFASCTLDDLKTLSSLLMGIYSVSRQNKKRSLWGVLSADLMTCVSVPGAVMSPLSSPAAESPVAFHAYMAAQRGAIRQAQVDADARLAETHVAPVSVHVPSPIPPPPRPPQNHPSSEYASDSMVAQPYSEVLASQREKIKQAQLAAAAAFV